MKASGTLIIDGCAYSWRRIVDLRRAQLEAWKAARPQLPELFELKEDCHPVKERSAARRYVEPTLLT